MSASNKSRFEVQKILRNAIISGLSYGGFDPSKYAVLESNQRPITNKQDAILFKYQTSSRVGLQATKFRIEKDSGGEITGFFKDDCFIDEQSWLIAVITRRPDTSSPDGSAITGDTILAEDVAQVLIAWFNGQGCLEIRKDGVSTLYINEMPIEIYKDDSSLYEKSASFTIKILVPKVISHTSPNATVEYAGEIPI